MSFFISFDIDGTLLKFGGASKNHPLAFAQAFKEILCPIGLPEKFLGRSVDGKTDFWITKELVKKITNKEDLPLTHKLQKRITEIYMEYTQPPNLVLGTQKLLEKLSSMDNVTLGISSGNFIDIGWRKLEITNLLQFFPKRICGMGDFDTRIEALNDSRKNVFKSGLKCDHWIHIGDTLNDVHSARKAGYFPIAINSGRRRITPDNQPMLIIDDYEQGFDQIMKILEE